MSNLCSKEHVDIEKFRAWLKGPELCPPWEWVHGALDELEHLRKRSRAWHRCAARHVVLEKCANIQADLFAGRSQALLARASAAERELAELRARTCDNCDLWAGKDAPMTHQCRACHNHGRPAYAYHCADWTPRTKGG